MNSSPTKAPTEKKPFRPWTTLLYVYLIVLMGVSAVAIIVVWPNEGVGASWLGSMSFAVRQLLLVIAGGILGSSLHAIQGLTADLDNPSALKRRLWRFFLDVLIAIPLTLTFYFLLRGLVLTPEAPIANINPSGLFCLSFGLGMWAPNALLRMTLVTTFAARKDVEQRLDRIGAALGVATVDNYRGFICLTINDVEGTEINRSSEEDYHLLCGRQYSLTVWFQPDDPPEIVSAKIEVTGGTDVSNVEFSLSADSEPMKLNPRNNAVSFGVSGRSPDTMFKFTAPESDGRGEVWVQVLQKNRLLEVVSVTIRFNSNDR
jgi:hypothetical protein